LATISLNDALSRTATTRAVITSLTVLLIGITPSATLIVPPPPEAGYG
jgi:hypothetical protein